jgi:RNA polymerase sigma factor (TIGR02999 family)
MKGRSDGACTLLVSPMSEVTRILSAIEQGDPRAAEQLLPLVYEELRKLAAAKLAQEKPGQTLEATALVHEAYLRLVGVEKEQQWNSRGHFFAAAAEAMRRILVENARRKKSAKHGGHLKRVKLDEDFTRNTAPDQLLALHDALDKLALEDPVKAELVKLRCFAGLSHQEAARALGISRPTADRYWVYAKTRLYCAIFEPEPEENG